MKSFCNWQMLTGLNKRLKTLAATFRAICFKNFLSLFAQSRMRKSNASTRTAIYHGGASAYWLGYSTATANKSFTGILESHRTACPNTWTIYRTSTTRTNTNGNYSHSNMTNNFMDAWQRITTGQTGMFEYFGKCIAKIEA